MGLLSSYLDFVAKLLLLALFMCATICAVQAEEVHLRWEVSYQFKSPDCYQKLAVAINGETPGPTIDAQQGDNVIVEVINGLLTENLAIHWHGIRQIGTPWSDGTDGLTQCPILPGETFTYNFTVDRPGTYLYHSHYVMQRSAGLYGLIRVAVPDGVTEPFAYDEDQSLLLSDWWHRSTYEQTTGLNSLPMNWIGEPQSLLINGRGKYNCSLAASGVCNETNTECSSSVVTVNPGKTYRLRVASATSLSALNIEAEGHNMTVVEADGHYVDPIAVKNLNIYSGETYSVILKADQDPSRNYWIAVNVVGREPATPTGTAILNYNQNQPTSLPPTVPPTGPLWNDTMYRFNQSIAIRAHPNYTQPPPNTTHRQIILLNTQNTINGRQRWSLNSLSLDLPHTPYLVAIKENLTNVFNQTAPPDTYDYENYDIYSVPKNPNATASSSIYTLELNSTVDVILQNANTLSPNTSETHPWHLHGHDFWVMGYGIGKFDPKTDPSNYTRVNPIMKNTVVLHPYGWTALRFQANNPGVWIFHCHIEAHFFFGMGVVFQEGVDKVGELPRSIMGCGESKSLIRP